MRANFSFGVAHSALTNGRTYTIHSQATDTDSVVQDPVASATFVYDTSAPAAPATPAPGKLPTSLSNGEPSSWILA